MLRRQVVIGVNQRQSPGFHLRLLRLEKCNVVGDVGLDIGVGGDFEPIALLGDLLSQRR